MSPFSTGTASPPSGTFQDVLAWVETSPDVLGGAMTNDRLRASIHAAGLTTEELSDRIHVDPKTIERWISKGRLPHRANRQEVAQALDRTETFLWPEAHDAAETAANAEAEVVRIYPSRGSIPSTTWGSLIEGAEQSIDILAFAGSFLHDAVPDFINLIEDRAARGVSVRLLFGDPDSSAVAVRGEEEQIGTSLAERCRLSWKYLSPLRDVEGVEMRQHGCTLYASIFRFDDDLLANTHLLGLPASQAPTLHFKRVPAAQLLTKYTEMFDAVWRRGVVAA